MSYASLSALIWSVADLLRNEYRPAEYGKVILPFTVLRRLDCLLAPTRAAFLAVMEEDGGKDAPERLLLQVSKARFVNTSAFVVRTLMGDPDHLSTHLTTYVATFSPGTA